MSDGDHQTIKGSMNIVPTNPFLRNVEKIAIVVFRSTAVLTIVCEGGALMAAEFSQTGAAHTELSRWHSK